MGARSLALALTVATVLALLLGVSAGGEGLSFAWQADATLIGSIRAPRVLAAACAGALLGLAGAVSQGLFRNPLADPFLLGAAAGAGLGVVLALAAAPVALAAVGSVLDADSVALDVLSAVGRLGVIGAAFLGALGGVLLSLVVAGGAGRPIVLLLAGVVVGVLLTAVADAIVWLAPELLRGRQVFLLGSTALVGWPGVASMAFALALALPVAMRLARVLDALVLGEQTARSLGVPLARARALLVLVLAWATGAAVAQVGLVAFVGLVAPHLVRRQAALTHAPLLAFSAWTGAVLLALADAAARLVVSPQELPVGTLTAVLGGLYLLVLLKRRGAP